MKLKKWFNIKINALVILFCGVMLGFGLSQNSDGLWLFSTGDAVSSSKMNENFQMLMNRIKTLEQTVSSTNVPSGTVAAFNLDKCPTNWKAADGDSNTPDLRGRFIRGLNKIVNADDSFKTPQNSANGDPDTRDIKDYQNDTFKTHNHGGSYLYHNGKYSGETHVGSADNRNLGSITTMTSQGGAETRPKNVALIFCVKN